jgi:hypothetical protein
MSTHTRSFVAVGATVSTCVSLQTLWSMHIMDPGDDANVPAGHGVHADEPDISE